MKVCMKPVKMISWADENGIVTPIKFQMKDENDEYITITVNNIILREEEKLAGNRMILFKCQSEIKDVLKIYELKLEISTCKWFLFKI